ncbi:hypothetical protein V6N11_018074 [Hibiscus sabdariffa]|uniref:PHD finger protein ALFIN-LIKE n=1 Tax=Hibiscus sabdariffa TaxID=183260 RepID=A0ABR2T6V9_9ROSI
MEGVPRTVEEVFNDFRGRRSGLIKALTTDVDKFYQQCDPEKENLCLYGLPNETWEVNLPVEENERKRLFRMISELPTIFEVVTGNVKQPKDQYANHNSSSKSKSNAKVSRQSGSESKVVKMSPLPKDEEESGEDEEDEEQGATCGACGDSYGADEFWICCDVCERWFHGKCVKITPAKAEHIKQYKCPSCSSKRARV